MSEELKNIQERNRWLGKMQAHFEFITELLEKCKAELDELEAKT